MSENQLPQIGGKNFPSRCLGIENRTFTLIARSEKEMLMW